MSEARKIIDQLSEEFPAHVIQVKPGSNRKPATKYVSHGSCTKRLNAVCPGWSSRVVETYTYVNPAGLLVCAGVLLELTIPGAGSRQEFGTANQPRNFGDDAKNAASDALKRAAMRFGVALDLWEDMDEADEDAQGEPAASAAPPTPITERRERDTALLAILRDPNIDAEARKKALHEYYKGAATVAELNQRVDMVAGAGLPREVLTAGYNHHHGRLAKQFAPASHAG
jgi:hypothetical protein